MRKRFRVGIALLLVAVIGGVTWLVLRPREPWYHGKPLSFWVIRCNYPKWNGQGFIDLQEALQATGTNSIPTLLRMLRRKDSVLTLKLLALAKSQHVISISYIPASAQNVAAAYGIAKLGSNAWNAVPALTEIYQQDISESSQSSAAYALGELGPAASMAVPALLRGVDDTNSMVRYTALHTLGKIHAQPESVVPVLIQCLLRNDQRYRQGALLDREGATLALGKFGPDAAKAVPALTLALQDAMAAPPTSARSPICLAAETLGLIGPPAVSAIPVLTTLLDRPEPFVRGQAAIALWRIDANAGAALPVLSLAFDQLSRDDKWKLIYELGRMGAGASEAFPLLTNELNNSDSTLRELATNVLKQINPEAAAKAGVK
jgi:HEAT repeat protein